MFSNYDQYNTDVYLLLVSYLLGVIVAFRVDWTTSNEKWRNNISSNILQEFLNKKESHDFLAYTLSTIHIFGKTKSAFQSVLSTSLLIASGLSFLYVFFVFFDAGSEDRGNYRLDLFMSNQDYDFIATKVKYVLFYHISISISFSFLFSFLEDYIIKSIHKKPQNKPLNKSIRYTLFTLCLINIIILKPAMQIWMIVLLGVLIHMLLALRFSIF